MKFSKLLPFFLLMIIVTSCKKNTLVEQIDVPATPIETIKVESGTSKSPEVKANEGSFEMIPLNFEYKALEPHFDAATNEIHFSKHHLGYVNNLNKAIIGTKYEIMSLGDILKNLNLSDANIRNNAGGYYNHNFFWANLTPTQNLEPTGSLKTSINRDFGSFEEFRNQFVGISSQYFGSGWCWLVSDKTGSLKIVTTANNDNPLMKGIGISGTPLLNLDLWEHAYYLKFQNKRREYANTFFSIINWENVSKKYDAIPNKIETIGSSPTTTTKKDTAKTANAKPMVKKADDKLELQSKKSETKPDVKAEIKQPKEEIKKEEKPIKKPNPKVEESEFE